MGYPYVWWQSARTEPCLAERRGGRIPGWPEGRPETGESLRYIGISRPRIDAREKVTGAARYASDLAPRGLLHARIVSSVYAHARIRSITAATALAVPGVVAVLTARDLPIVGEGPERRFEPLARDEVVFAGQPVALVIGETEAAAEDGADLVQVDLEPLEPVVDVLAAIEPGSPVFRIERLPAPDEGVTDVDGAPVSGNVFSRTREQRGDVDAAFARCDAVVEGRFRAGWVYQAYLEPHAAVGWVEPDGTLAVTSGNQGTSYPRSALGA